VTAETEVWLVRHGETEWSRHHRHTSRTDLPLTIEGQAAARRLRAALDTQRFDRVLTSPLQRARTTAELAGFDGAEVDERLVEWDYGDYEGRTTEEIRRDVPGWTVWTHESPGGERANDVARRLDGVVDRIRGEGGRWLLFAHGHVLRALAARWIDEPVAAGRSLLLQTATVSVLGYERDVSVIARWNCPVT
jgi:probable phosphoglycerate mutase